MGHELILASGSPRRQEFLRALGLDFAIEAADIDETRRPDETPEALVERLSRDKTAVVGRRHAGTPVVAADTVVVLDGQILGKPADAGEAWTMLRALRDRMHVVYTAVSVGAGEACHTRLCRSEVWMRPYSDAEIGVYVATGDPLDKAGAYAIQHPLFSPVAHWEGCYAGIMGLPLGMLAELLSRFGILMPKDVIGVCEQFSGRCCLRGIPRGC